MSHKKLIAFIILINYFQIKVFCFVDYNSVQNINSYNLSSVIFKNVTAKTNYKLTWVNFADTHSANSAGAQLVVSLPPQLRLRQQLGRPTRHRVEVVDGSGSFRIREASRMHRGFYSAYKVVTDSNNNQYVSERKDFYIHIKGLAVEDEYCSEDSSCESNYCLSNRCICNREEPVPDINRNCYPSQPIGSKCLHSSQCKFNAGNNSVCDYKGKCRCIKNAFAIQLPVYGKYCVEPKVLYDSCLYSEQCQVIGTNRYCSQNFTCQCIPDYHYRVGVGCLRSSNNISPLMPSSNIWLLLVLTIVAKINL